MIPTSGHAVAGPSPIRPPSMAERLSSLEAIAFKQGEEITLLRTRVQDLELDLHGQTWEQSQPAPQNTVSGRIG